MNETPPDTLMDHARMISEHFGLHPLEYYTARAAALPVQMKSTAARTEPRPLPDPLHSALTSGVRAFHTHKLAHLKEPIGYYSFDRNPDALILSFHLVNAPSAMADALLIQLSRSLACMLGYPHVSTRIGIVGDHDSKRRFIRETTAFLRKHSADLPDEVASLIPSEPLTAREMMIRIEHDLAPHMPLTVDHLNERSRRHFRELLEYLDLSPIQYEFDPYFIGNHEINTGILFTGTHTEVPPFSAYGSRYDSYTQHALGACTPAVSLYFAVPETAAADLRPVVPTYHHPSVYLISIGLAAKMRGIMVLDELLTAGIPVSYNLNTLTLTDQLAEAAQAGTRFVLMIGMQEVRAKNVIVRDMHANEQWVIPNDKLMQKLGSFLRK